MQTPHQIKNFTCQLHPSEVIERVCLNNNVGSSLVCIECILNNKIPKDALITLDEFLENAIKQEKTFQNISAFEKNPPQDLIDFLAQEEENIQKLSQHIEQENQRVNASFDVMIQEFTQICQRKKSEIALQLDKQLIALKFNYAYYKSNLEKFSHNPDKETLTSRINQCKDTNQFELLVKNIKDDLQEASIHESPEEKIYQIKEILRSHSQILQEQAKSIPKIKFCDQIASDASLREFRKATEKFMEDFVEIDNQISKLSFPNVLRIDSKLIKKQKDLNLLKEWLEPSHKDFQLRLLYRGTRDGMDCESFHEKCDKHSTTLTIAKSNHGKVFGGYTDKSWNVSDDYKVSQNSWLFSIDEKLKFPILKEGFPYAIYSVPHLGPIFGGGHDLCIAFPEDNAESKSSSNLGSSYKKAKDQNKTILAGSQEFDTVELEVYSVEKFGLHPRNYKLDSKIINSTQDLYLIENWLGRGKDYKLELIYRGNNRDGTSAFDFHLYCDNKGPTLVICKSKEYDQVFGGFTSKNWSQENVYVEDQEAFLFSLTHGTKHPIIEKEKAIFCSWEYGPVFGAGKDLFICSENNITADSRSILGASYQVDESVEEKESYLAGEKTFLLEEIEVFAVKIMGDN